MSACHKNLDFKLHQVKLTDMPPYQECTSMCLSMLRRQNHLVETRTCDIAAAGTRKDASDLGQSAAGPSAGKCASQLVTCRKWTNLQNKVEVHGRVAAYLDNGLTGRADHDSHGALPARDFAVH